MAGTATTPLVSAFNWVPDFAKGRVRDLRVRWAYEEIGRPYETLLLNAGEPRGEEYVRWQPFDQVPALRDGDIEMFESGAILLRIGEQDEQLLPVEEQARWTAISWLVAALNSVEPAVAQVSFLTFFHADKPWAADAAEGMKPFARRRLQRLADALGGKDWIAGEFSIADIAMVTSFLTDGSELVEEQPSLVAYRDRAHARPAYKRALQAQLDDFHAEPPRAAEGG